MFAGLVRGRAGPGSRSDSLFSNLKFAYGGDLCERVAQIYGRLYYKSFDTFSVSRLDELFSFLPKLLSLYFVDARVPDDVADGSTTSSSSSSVVPSASFGNHKWTKRAAH